MEAKWEAWPEASILLVSTPNWGRSEPTVDCPTDTPKN